MSRRVGVSAVAVSFVDGEQRERRLLKDAEEFVCQQALRRDVNHIDRTGAHLLLDGARFVARCRRIQRGGLDAELAQRRDLILHQRDERRDHDADALAA
jgi:hypothetical protein